MRILAPMSKAFGIALAVTLPALVLRMFFDPFLGSAFPYIFFFLAAIVAAWFGGLGAGLVSTLLAAIIVAIRYAEPGGSILVTEASDQVAMVLFLLVGSIISVVTANFRQTAIRQHEAAAQARQREEEYRSFFELSAVGAAEHAPPDGRFIRVNRKLAELTGYTQEELLGMSLASLTHPDDRAADMQAYRKLLSGEVNSNELEKRYLRKDGSFIWVISNRTAIRRGDGKLLRTVAVIQDVGARHRAEEAQRFLISASTILGSSLDPEETMAAIGDLCVGSLCHWCTIILAEPDGSLRRVAVVHRDPSKRLLVRELIEKFPPTRESQHEIVHVITSGQAVLRNEVPRDVQVHIEAKPELQAILSELGYGPYLIVPLTSRGRTLGALTLVSSGKPFDESDLAVARELGLRAAMAIDNATLFRASEAANRSKDEFFATVSHELKTPMTTILGWSQMLRSERLDEATAHTAIDSIYRSALAQAKIIDDILDVARISTGKLALESAPVDLPALLEDVFHAMKPAADATQVSLRLVNERGSASTIVVGDATRLQQIFINLISNAVKFTPARGQVDVRLSSSDGTAVVTVTDTGVGIEADFLPHVFDAFRQGRHGASKGLGLGLTIARRLVESHGGTIEAWSDGPGKGTRFRVTLPLATQPAA